MKYCYFDFFPAIKKRENTLSSGQIKKKNKQTESHKHVAGWIWTVPVVSTLPDKLSTKYPPLLWARQHSRRRTVREYKKQKKNTLLPLKFDNKLARYRCGSPKPRLPGSVTEVTPLRLEQSGAREKVTDRWRGAKGAMEGAGQGGTARLTAAGQSVSEDV